MKASYDQEVPHIIYIFLRALENYRFLHECSCLNTFVKRLCRSRRGTGGSDPFEEKNTGFLSNTGPDTLTKLQSIQCWAIADDGASLEGR